MVRFNSESLFGGHIDIDDAAVVRRVMNTIEYFMAHNVIPGTYIPHGVGGGLEKAGDLALMLLSTCRNAAQNTLLLEALIAFVDGRYGTNDEVVAAARILEATGTEEILAHPNRDRAGHQAALDHFQLHHYELDTSEARLEALRHRAPGAFWNQTIHSFSAVDQIEFERQLRELPINTSISAQLTLFKMAEDSKNKAAGKASNEQLVHGGGSGERAGGDKGKEKRARSVSEDASELGHTPSAKKAKMIESGQEEADNAVSDDGSGLTDPPSDIDMQDGPGEREENKEPAEDEPEEDSSSDDDSDDDSSDGSWDRGPPLKPNTPFTRPGERVVNPDSINRRPAKVGHKKMRKAHIKFLLERDDPKKPGKVLYRKATWHHQSTVDWSNLASVRKLNERRGQLFKRLLGPSRGPRLIWTESEMFAVFEILQEHLVEIGGRYSSIDWDVVATQLDERFHGTVFQIGEPIAARRYKVNGVTTTSIAATLKKAATFEARSGLAIRSQLGAFTHPTAQEILTHAKVEDEKAKKQDSDDEQSEKRDSDDNHSDDRGGTGRKIKGSNKGEGGSKRKSGKGNKRNETKKRTKHEDEREEGTTGVGDDGTEEPFESEFDIYMRKETEKAERESAIAAAAEEERQMAILTHPRTIAKDKAGARWPKGG